MCIMLKAVSIADITAPLKPKSTTNNARSASIAACFRSQNRLTSRFSLDFTLPFTGGYISFARALSGFIRLSRNDSRNRLELASAAPAPTSAWMRSTPERRACASWAARPPIRCRCRGWAGSRPAPTRKATSSASGRTTKPLPPPRCSRGHVPRGDPPVGARLRPVAAARAAVHQDAVH